MKAVIQRVKEASVFVNKKKVANISKGLVVLIAIEKGDTKQKADKFIQKLLKLRIFSDKENKMNKDLLEINGNLLLVSQFTLAADLKKGRRPSFLHAEEPAKAKIMFNYMVEKLREKVVVETGIFGAYMQLQLVNDGPVTIILSL